MCSKTSLIILSVLILTLGVFLGKDGFSMVFLFLKSTIEGSVNKSKLEPVYVAIRNESQLTDKYCLVTGTSRGLGKSIAAELVALGCHVFLAQRDMKMNTEVEVMEMAKSLRKNVNGKAEKIELDLNDIDSVLNCVETLIKKVDKLHILVLNAAILPTETKLTKQGFERQFGVNYLGHILLVNTLLEKSILKSDDQIHKIIFVISNAHKMSPSLVENEFGKVVQYTMGGAFERYSYTKLCLATYVSELIKRVDPKQTSINFYDPGPVDTEIARDAPAWMAYFLDPLMAILFKTPEASAMPVAYQAVSKDFEGVSGKYLIYWTDEEVDERALNEQTAAWVWEKTNSLLKERKPPQ